MIKRCFLVGSCLLVIAAAVWIAGAGYGDKKTTAAWTRVAPGVYRTPGLPAGYALVDKGSALLIDAPQDAAGLAGHGVKEVDAVLLTHHHRDTCAAAGRFLAAGVKVRAPRAAAEWLTQTWRARELADRLRGRSGRIPRHFQVVLKVAFKQGIPVHSSYVFHHALGE